MSSEQGGSGKGSNPGKGSNSGKGKGARPKTTINKGKGKQPMPPRQPLTPPLPPLPPRAPRMDSGLSMPTSAAGIQFWRSTELVKKILILLHGFPDGLLFKNIHEQFLARNEAELDTISYGFHDLMEFFDYFPYVFRLEKLESGEWLVFSAAKSQEDINSIVAIWNKNKGPPIHQPEVLSLMALGQKHATEWIDKPNVIEEVPNQEPPGSKFHAMITEVYSPSHFWMIRAGYDKTAHKQCVEGMTRIYNSMEWQRWREVKIGNYCAVYCREKWYRALIIRLIKDDDPTCYSEAVIRLIDLGQIKRKSMRHIRPLMNCFTYLPAVARRGRLAGVGPFRAYTPWPLKDCKFFSNFVINKQYPVRVTRNLNRRQVLELEVMKKSHKINETVNSDLIIFGFAERRFANTNEAHFYPSFRSLENGQLPNLEALRRLEALGIPPSLFYYNAVAGSASDEASSHDEAASTSRFVAPSISRYVSPSTSRYVSASSSRYVAPSTSRYVAPSTSRYVAPSTSRYVAPSTSRYVAPSTSRYVAPSTSRYVAPSTSRYVAPSTSRYVAPSTSRYVAPSTSRYVAPSTSRYVAPSTSRYVAPSTSGGEAASTSRAEAASTSHYVAPSASGGEAASTSRAEAASTSRAEAASTSRAEAASTSRAEAASTSRAEAASTSRAEAASTSRAEAASTSRAEAASPSGVEAAEGDNDMDTS